MGNTAALQSVWTTLTGTTAQKLAALNSMKAAGPPQDISISALSAFLTANNLMGPLTTYAQSGANETAKIACNYILAILSAGDPTIHTSIAANYAAIQQLGPGLVADPATGVTDAILAEMMGMITPPQLWWQVNGFGGAITITDLIAAGNLY